MYCEKLTTENAEDNNIFQSVNKKSVNPLCVLSNYNFFPVHTYTAHYLFFQPYSKASVSLPRLCCRTAASGSFRFILLETAENFSGPSVVSQIMVCAQFNSTLTVFRQKHFLKIIEKVVKSPLLSLRGVKRRSTHGIPESCEIAALRSQ